METLGKRLRRLRQQAELTQQQVSDLLTQGGIKTSRVSVNRWESDLQVPKETRKQRRSNGGFDSTVKIISA